MDLSPLLEAARRAADLCSTVQETMLLASHKIGAEPVTVADYGSQALICEAISRAFPGDAVMAEESGAQFLSLVAHDARAAVTGLIGEALGRTVTESEVVGWLDYGKDTTAHRVWVIDPIDGTKGFLAKRHYAIAIGILEDGEITGGVMACPGYPGIDGGAMFWAQDGVASMQAMSGGDVRQIHVTATTASDQVRALESVEKSHAGFEQMAAARQAAGLGDAKIEQIDSMEKYARIAAGDAELYLRLPRQGSTRPHSTWDHAAGAALVLAAGGMLSDVDGSPIDFSKGRALPNEGIIVTNGAIHAQIIDGVMRSLGRG
jgi:3'(2'), 5'-bisphosphate nucleotidase